MRKFDLELIVVSLLQLCLKMYVWKNDCSKLIANMFNTMHIARAFDAF